MSSRGAKEPNSSSSAQMKSIAKNLIEKTGTGFLRQYGKLIWRISLVSELCLQWNSKQEELKRKGPEDKEIANLALDRRKDKDLENMKAMGGPFTSSRQVDESEVDNNNLRRGVQDTRLSPCQGKIISLD